MRTFITIVVWFISLPLIAQEVDTVDFRGHSFYHIRGDGNGKLLVFLHGGLGNPVFGKESERSSLEFLLEGNSTLAETAESSGFDLLIPVSDSRLNWLNEHSYCFEVFRDYLAVYGTDYHEQYIAGFSDGGTGSYKIFYEHPDYFDGLAVLNGYPQHRNFYLNVDYSVGADQKVVFFSTLEDKRIPYEFLLTEYCKQKRHNPDTYLYVTEGKHAFNDYTTKDLELMFDLLMEEEGNTGTDPIHAFIRRDSVIAFYPFRKKICRKYGYGEEYLEMNREQERTVGGRQ